MKKSMRLSLLLSLFALSFSVAGCNNNEPTGKYENKKIFDWYHDNYSPLGPTTFELEEYDNPKFEVSIKKTLTQENTSLKFEGVHALFAYDINKDGYRDLCISASEEGGVDYSYIYDLKNNEYLYYIKESKTENVGRHYHLYLEKNVLGVTKDKNDGYGTVDNTYAKATLMYSKDRGVYASWSNIYSFSKCDFTLTTMDPDNTPVEIKKGKNLSTADVNTSSLYRFQASYQPSASDGYTDILNIFSFAYHTIGQDNIKVVDASFDSWIYTMIFYFTEDRPSGAFDYEIQASGFNENFRFNISTASEKKSVGELISASSKIKAVTDVSKLVLEENQYYTSGRFYGLRFIDEVTNEARVEYAFNYFSSQAYEVSEAFYKTKVESSVRLNYYDKTGNKYPIEVNNGHYFMINGKCYASFEELKARSIVPMEFGRDTKVGFFKDMKNIEIDDLVNNTKIKFDNLDLIEAYCYSVSSEYPYPEEGISACKYKIDTGLKNHSFYIVDANTFINDGYSKEVYRIVSERNFASLFQ